MRKNYIYLLFLFLFASTLFAQKVTITPTSVNGSNVNAGPINLASIPYSTVSLGVKVEFPAGAAVGDQGTIKVYYINSVALGANVANGGDGGTLFFGGGKTATRSFTINLNWSDFQTSGGFVYAEYKSSNSASAIAYKSAYLSVIKNATMTTGTNLNPPADAPNPTKISNTLCCNQTVRLGDKPAIITGTTYLNPYQGEPYGINSSWAANGLNSVRFISNSPSSLEIDYLTETGKFTVTRGLGYRYGGQYPNKSNAVTITVVPSPILSNTIDQNNANTIDSNGFAEFSSLKSVDITGTLSHVSLNMLKDPNHIYDRTDEISRDATYSWEYTKTNKESTLDSKIWIPIISENSSNLYGFNPTITNSEDNYYIVRRIASYQGISRISNEVKIMTRTMGYNNTICCDQILKIISLTDYEAPNTIIGSTPTIDSSTMNGNNFSILGISYQWQNQIQGRSLSAWTDIPAAISKDYLPSLSSLKVITGSGRRGTQAFVLESSYIYRRITKINYQIFNPNGINKTVTSYSNEVSLTASSDEPYIKIYPNPTSSVLNIQSTTDISKSKVTITNITGNTINYNFSVVNPNLISVDISQLTNGTYFIAIENRDISLITFIKQ